MHYQCIGISLMHCPSLICYVIQTGVTRCGVLPTTLCCLYVMLFKQVLHAAGCCPPLHAVYVLCYSNRYYMLQGAARHSMLSICYVIPTGVTCCGVLPATLCCLYVMLFKQVLHAAGCCPPLYAVYVLCYSNRYYMLQGAARHSMLSICYVIQTGVTCCRVLPATLCCLYVMLFKQVLHAAGCCPPLYAVYVLCYSNRCYTLGGAASRSMMSICYFIQRGVACCRVLPAALCCLYVMLFKQVLHAAGCCPPLYAVYMLCYSNRCYMLQGAACHFMLSIRYVIQTGVTCCRVLPATLCCLYVMLFKQVLHAAGCCPPLYAVYMLCYSNRCYMLQGAARHSMLSITTV